MLDFGRDFITYDETDAISLQKNQKNEIDYKYNNMQSNYMLNTDPANLLQSHNTESFTSQRNIENNFFANFYEKRKIRGII